jgi:iron only hydrogenase large subunit-like protein
MRADSALLLCCCCPAAKPKEERKVMIAQIAPAVRVAIAEAVGLNPGDVSVGQLVAGLRQLGFDYVFGESRLLLQQ